MSIPTLIISKDRACQLSLLLQSLGQNAPDLFDITVILKSSTDEYIDAYVSLMSEYPHIEWQCEVNCNDDFYDWLNDNTHPLTAFFTDDCIFYRKNKVLEDDLLKLFSMQNLWTFTYRLGNNITIQDYTRNNCTDLPRMFVEKYNSLLWDYQQVQFDHSFGWSVGLDGYVWRTQDLRKLLDYEDFNHFTKLEGLMVRKFKELKTPPCMMASPENSNVFVQQINVVHNDRHNTIGKFNATPKELNDRFLAGERISLSSMNFAGVNCTHGEIPWSYT